MTGAETAGIVAITMAVIETLTGLVKYVIGKYTPEKQKECCSALEHKVERINQRLASLHDMHTRFDSEGVPVWYFPRGWTETQKEIVDKLQVISQLEMKMLGIIERLERRLENH